MDSSSTPTSSHGIRYLSLVGANMSGRIDIPNQSLSNISTVSACSSTFNIKEELEKFWDTQTKRIDTLDKYALQKASQTQELPLARIKKIMKLDDEVKHQMISAEVPILFAKAAELFVEEMTLRAWIHTEENKRKTLQKSDISLAVGKYDQFDFLIDIVPREESKPSKRSDENDENSPGCTANGEEDDPQNQVFIQAGDQLLNCIQLGVQQGAQVVQLQNGQSLPGLGQSVQILNGFGGSHNGQPVQIMNASSIGAQQGGQPVQFQIVNPQSLASLSSGGGPTILNLNEPSTSSLAPANPHTSQPPNNSANSGPGGSEEDDSSDLPQVFQQVVGTDGTIQHIKLDLSEQELKFLKQKFQQQTTTIVGSGGDQQQPAGPSQGGGGVQQAGGSAGKDSQPSTSASNSGNNPQAQARSSHRRSGSGSGSSGQRRS